MIGGRNAQSDKNAAEAAAFAERMRPVAYRAAVILNERGVPSAMGGRCTGPGGPGAPAASPGWPSCNGWRAARPRRVYAKFQRRARVRDT